MCPLFRFYSVYPLNSAVTNSVGRLFPHSVLTLFFLLAYDCFVGVPWVLTSKFTFFCVCCHRFVNMFLLSVLICIVCHLDHCSEQRYHFLPSCWSFLLSCSAPVPRLVRSHLSRSCPRDVHLFVLNKLEPLHL
jgi:hypothetical protein